MLTIGQERESQCVIEIGAGSDVRAMTFASAGCECLVSGHWEESIRVWRVEDGEQVATVAADHVYCLAVSEDGRWLAAGTYLGDVLVWDVATHKQIFAYRKDSHGIHGVDFSPDSTHLVIASWNCTATILDLTTQEQARTLVHDGDGAVVAAKYSPQGDRIATATHYSVRVWGTSEGQLFMTIDTKATPRYNTGLLWLDNHLFVASDGKIERLDASTGSIVSKWSVTDSVYASCIALPKHERFVAYSANRTVTFWDTSTHFCLRIIRHSQDIRSIAFSPDDRSLVIGGVEGKSLSFL